MVTPPKISSNDKALILSPAGSIDVELIKGAENILTKWGLSVEISNHASNKAGRFSGTIIQRYTDLQSAFDDTDCKLILCSRGGYGAIHLIDKIDLTRFKQHPKWLIGYSDITILHSLLQVNGISSIHGPMAKHFAEEGENDTSVKLINSIINGYGVNYQLTIPDYNNLNKNGTAKGPLFGGNLAVFCGLLGTQYSYIPSGGILFIEDIGESPYKIDRFLHQLKLAGVFKQISGLIVGQFTEYEEDPLMYAPLYKSIFDILIEYDFPICFNFPVGHVTNNVPLIMGNKATLKIEGNQIELKQILETK